MGLATPVWLALAALVAFMLWLRRGQVLYVGGGAGKAMPQDVWRTALLLSTAVGLAGLGIVSLLALHSPNIAGSVFKGGPYLNKRWVVALYLLCIGLLYLPGVIKGILAPRAEPQDTTPERSDALGVDPTGRKFTTKTVARAFLAFAAGSIAAVLYVGPLIPGTLERRLDSHELVHLGAIERIAQGARPYVGARTQYGPGHQFVSYKLMEKTAFTVRGFRVAHLVSNLAVVALFFFVTLLAFGWTTGAWVVVAALFVSPLQTTSFVGWGVLARWLAPYIIGVWAPAVLWGTSTATRQRAAFALMGVTCGVLAWFSQENATTSVLTVLVVLAAAVIRCGLSLRAAALLAGVFAVCEVLVLVGLLAWLVGVRYVSEAVALYRRAGTLVLAGMMNAPWSTIGSDWSRPSPTWTLAFYLTPCVIVLLAITALYVVPPGKTLRDDAQIGQLLGMIGAAASLYAFTPQLRSDAVHFIGSSMAVAPLVVLSTVHLPDRLFRLARHRVRARAVMAGAFVLIYPFFWSAPEFKIPPLVHLDDLYRGATLLSQIHHDAAPVGATESGSVLWRRMGFRQDPESRCCNIRRCCGQADFTYGDWAVALEQVRAAVGKRTAYVDTRDALTPFGESASAVYFLGELQVGTAFVEPMMSLWVDDDLVSAKEELRQHLPECLVTGGGDFLMTPFLLGQYGEYTTVHTTGAVRATVHCVKGP